MCNLYRQRATENLSRLFDAHPLQERLELRPDIYPKYDACVVRKDEAGRRVAEAMAWGIIATIKGKSGKPIQKRFAFLTCEPNPLVAPLHPKAMPVILHREDYSRWLDGEADDVCALALPFPSQLMAVA